MGDRERPISVLVADSQRLLAEAVATSLDKVAGLHSLAEFPTTGDAAVRAAIRLRPDVVVLDFWITGDLNGPLTTEAIRARVPGAKVLLVSWLHGPQHVESALEAGAAGFLPKSLPVARLADAIRRADAGESPVYAQELRNLVETIDDRAKEVDESLRRFARLTAREQEVLTLLVQRRSAQRVADELFVSYGTVRNHVQEIRGKIGVKTQDDLVRLARKVAPHLLGRAPAAGGWRAPAKTFAGCISVLVADEQQLLADALGHALGLFGDLAVTAVQFGSGGEALQVAVSTRPDVVLYDYWMPTTNGPAAARYLSTWSPNSRIVLLSWLHGASQVARTSTSGAAGLVSKRATLRELVETIREAHAGRHLTHAEPGRPAAGRTQEADEAGLDVWTRLATLTPREVAVLQLLSNGASRFDVARHLLISPGTAKNHVTHLLKKLEVQSTLDALELARSEGLVRETGAPASTSRW